MSNIEYLGPSRLPDNQLIFLQEILTIAAYSDPDYKAKLNVKPDEVIVHITPSDPKYKQEIVNNMLWINRNLKQRIRFSKSLAISSIISFTVSLENSQEHLNLHG